jgi:hypothetical protein
MCGNERINQQSLPVYVTTLTTDDIITGHSTGHKSSTSGKSILHRISFLDGCGSISLFLDFRGPVQKLVIEILIKIKHVYLIDDYTTHNSFKAHSNDGSLSPSTSKFSVYTLL